MNRTSQHSRPTPGASFDRTHPFGRNLVAEWLCNEGAGPTLRDSVQGAILTLAGNAAWTTGPGGRMLLTNDAGGAARASGQLPHLRINLPLTLVWRGMSLGTPAANAVICGMEYDAAHSNPFSSYEIAYNNSSNLTCFYAYGGSGTQVNWNNGTSTITLPARQIVTLAMTLSYPDGGIGWRQAFYYFKGTEGNKLGIADAVARPAISYGATATFTIGGYPSLAGYNANIATEYVRVYSAALGPDILRQMTVDPYGHYPAPAAPLYFTIPAVAERYPVIGCPFIPAGDITLEID